MARPRPIGDLLTFGGRAPRAVGGLIAALLGASLVAALSGLELWLVLRPAALVQGEVWRLVTWTFVDRDPLSLAFAALMLFFFGRDLAGAWGERRLVVTFLVLGAASGLASCAPALWFSGLEGVVWAGSWAVISGLVVAWGLLFPERQIVFWFVVPVSGRGLVWLTVGFTVLYGAFRGAARVLPELAAEVLMFLWFRGVSPRGAWQSFRIWLGEQRMRRRARHLKVVRKNGKGDPPRWLN